MGIDKAVIEQALASWKPNIKNEYKLRVQPIKKISNLKNIIRIIWRKNQMVNAILILQNDEHDWRKDYPKPSDAELKAMSLRAIFRYSKINILNALLVTNIGTTSTRPFMLMSLQASLFFSSNLNRDNWPSFTKPIIKDVVHYETNNSFNIQRPEVLSRAGNAHLDTFWRRPER